MSEIRRVSVQEVRRKILSGSALLLVCAYATEEAFQAMHLEGGISFPDFAERLPSLPKDAEIVFY